MLQLSSALLLLAAAGARALPAGRELSEGGMVAPPTMPMPPNLPPSAPPPPPSANTTISFYNVGACAAVAAVKFDFADPDGLCPSVFRTQTGGRCHVPGPYGREVVVSFSGNIEELLITVLDPSADDDNLTAPTLLQIAPIQARNHVGAMLRPGTSVAGCALGFAVVSEAAASIPGVRGGYFRSIFRNSAVDAGEVRLVSNGDSTIATLSPGGRYMLDQLLVTPLDMPTPVTISFQSTATGATLASSAPEVDPASGLARRWGSTCEMSSTGFVLYGRPAAGLPLQVLRLDGAGDAVCSYTEAETAKFTAEVAFFNTVASGASFTFAFGLSPFLPYGELQTTDALAMQESAVSFATQPGEIYVKALDGDTGDVLVLSERVPIHAQRRNLIGVSLTASGDFRLDLLQAENATHATAEVAPDHFRLVFAHAALTLPAASVRANDDIDLVVVPAGGHAFLDHPRIPPHQAGRILKLTFQMAGQADVSTLIDLSTLCDGAAYGVVLVGTLDQLDAFDPLLVQVGGTATSCSLSTAHVELGTSSSLAMANLAPSADHAVRFEFGTTLLSLNRMSVSLAFRGAAVTDVPVGDLFVRLLKPDPPYEPLTPIVAVTIHPQARNALVARATGATGATDADGVAELAWGVLDLDSGGSMIGATSTRVVLLNLLEDSTGMAPASATADVSGSYSVGGLALPHASAAAFEIHHDGGASVSFKDAAGATLGDAASVAFGEACAQSVQLIALGGVRGETGALAPGPTHVDAADGYCRLVLPTIPEAEAIEQATTQPPATTSTLDIFGDNGPGDGGLFPQSPAAASGRRCGVPPVVFAALVLLISLVVSGCYY